MNSNKLPMNLSRQEVNDLLFKCFRAIYKFEQDKVRCFDLNYDAIFLLQFLCRQSPSTMGEISKEMQVPVSTATRVVDRLVAKDMVSRKKDSKDKRVMLVSLESEGKRLVKAVEDHSFEVIIPNFTELNEPEMASVLQTARLMEKLLEITEPK
ncbi:MAG: MarR family transcriptional regulator [Desulfobacteraceae bacterium]|nr:MarR family transcriptional regulator [Desulfobacteraceae bacterium]